MFLLGSLVNAGAILFGVFVGFLIPRMSERFQEAMMQGLALAVMLIGLDMALKDSQDIMYIIVSLVIGGLLGTWWDVEGKLLGVGRMVESRTRRVQGSTAEAFVTASLVFCVGAMAIVGAIQSGVSGVHKTLYAKSLLDMVSAIVFTTTMGLGVALAAIPVLIYEGAIATISHFAGAVLQNPPVIACMTATGGLLIVGIGISLMGVKKINVGNLLPAMFVSPVLKWLVPWVMQRLHG
ncbi:membrane protein [Alicyclobacillus contaminans]|uniref:DUF554 domain-containing protein n=1 Tax=Alicyclobacillus contaminans TaxID=392016 RepID=UPI00040D2700|nr:DUF554 domain-containing protein [Alicyclobacillus contaminans]GMA50754.1 membrane protein [Alicyclobacillus contaminans]